MIVDLQLQPPAALTTEKYYTVGWIVSSCDLDVVIQRLIPSTYGHV
jgi:hypothetical protein